jgi:hypothetical protein
MAVGATTRTTRLPGRGKEELQQLADEHPEVDVYEDEEYDGDDYVEEDANEEEEEDAGSQQQNNEEDVLQQFINRIHYSPRYNDDHFEYRHVILPRDYYQKYVPKEYKNRKFHTKYVANMDNYPY